MNWRWALRDSLFARMAWLGIAVLLVMHLVWSALVFYQRPRQQVDGFARGLLVAILSSDGRQLPSGANTGLPGRDNFAGHRAGNLSGNTHSPSLGTAPTQSTRAVDDAGVSSEGPPSGPPSGPPPDGTHRPPEFGGPPPDGGPPPGVLPGMPPGGPRGMHRVPLAEAPKFAEPSPGDRASHLRHELLSQLPPGTELHLVESGVRPVMWVHLPDTTEWVVLPLDLPPVPPFVRESFGILAGAVLLALLMAWQMHLPISRVAHAARVIARGRRPALLPEDGPHELRDLAHAFNEMAKRLAEAEDNQTIMLAGIAHDLKSPLTRLRLRADLSGDENLRDGFVRDISSIDHIVQQFLAYARAEPDTSPKVGVDEFLREQFPVDDVDVRSGRDASEDDEGSQLFTCELHAGPQFELPRTVLDRLVSNLVDNALEHGEPPVRLATWREGDTGCIEVTDCGEGIPNEQIALAMRPFVRLDASRGGEGHCGLGLSLVARLVEEMGGNVRLDKAPAGGLRVTLRMPGTAGNASVRAAAA